MTRTTVRATICATVLFSACGRGSDPLPLPVPLRGQTGPDLGFSIKPRPGCSPEVIGAARDAKAIARAAGAGANFTCGPATEPLPLDDAVREDDSARVRALLEAGADSNARWSSHGDRFPLQEAIEARSYGSRTVHRAEIIHLLLQHGADPNARWCPFESRGFIDRTGCVSAGGVTALMLAAASDEPEIVFRLLDAGGHPAVEDYTGANALDYARGEAVLYLLLASAFPDAHGRAAEALRYLNARPPPRVSPGPWDETPLARAIVGHFGGALIAPPPPPPRKGRGPVSVVRSGRVARVNVLLTLGANPNQRLDWGAVDWTPLALAIAAHDPEVVRTLLEHGADPNARWCVPIHFFSRTVAEPPPSGCTTETGITPLMLAASLDDRTTVTLLLAHGADPQLRDWSSKTALTYAMSAKKRGTADTLLGAAVRNPERAGAAAEKGEIRRHLQRPQ